MKHNQKNGFEKLARTRYTEGKRAEGNDKNLPNDHV